MSDIEKILEYLREGSQGKLDLRWGAFDNIRLQDADLSGIDFSNADLKCAYLKGANLSGANLSYTDLSGANLTEANLSNANLSNATLNFANFCGACLIGIDVTNAKTFNIMLEMPYCCQSIITDSDGEMPPQ